MVIVKQSDVRANMKRYLDMAAAGEYVLIPRAGNQNVALISQEAYRLYLEYKRELNNREYLAMIKQSEAQLADGKLVTKTIEELEEMAGEDA